MRVPQENILGTTENSRKSQGTGLATLPNQENYRGEITPLKLASLSEPRRNNHPAEAEQAQQVLLFIAPSNLLNKIFTVQWISTLL